MKIEISSTKAVRQFGDCLARIKYRGDTFIITRNDEPVAELTPVSSCRRGTWGELEKAVDGLPRDASFADDLEKVNETDLIPANLDVLVGPRDESHFRRVDGLGVRVFGG